MGSRTMTRTVPAALTGSVEQLAHEFAGVFARETVQECVLDSYERLQPGARITTHLPLLAYRFARERLRSCGMAKGVLPKTTPVVLFVCTHNAGRSQLAAALLVRAAGDRVTNASAGTAPAPGIDPVVLEALAERGVDARDAYPSPLTPQAVEAAQALI